MFDLDTREALSQTKFFEAYSRWNDEKNRYETWDEAVERVMNMHRKKYASIMTPELAKYIDDAEDLYKKKYFLGAQRALQFGGEQLLKNNMRLYNCFSIDTKFITSNGLKSFEDFNDNDQIVVLTHNGNWKDAVVKSYGEQQLNKITLSRYGIEKTIYATPNHRWILKDSTETTELKIGDKLYASPEIFSNFSFDESNDPLEKLYWCYGYVYGDGTINKDHSLVRLCDKDRQYEYRFKDVGFKSSSSASLNGDIICYTGSYKKTLPNIEEDSINLIRAFVRGYLDADGEKNVSVFNHDEFITIQASDEKAVEFIRNVFQTVGVYITNETDHSDRKTNFGVYKDGTIRFKIYTTSSQKTHWTVKSIESTNRKEIVWCLEVEDDSSFVLDGGIVTGNCTSSHANRPAFFGEFFWILLSGCGAGFSVQKHHIEMLPKIKDRTKQAKIHVIEDSIEGWGTSVDVLLSSYFVGGGKHPEYEGRRVYFDTTKIRDKNAMISGGFKAPGPEPLRKALDKIEHLIQGLILAGDTTLRPIHVYDICMFLADAVLSGGVRRAATIALFSKDDVEMLNAKIGDWFIKNPQRARSNNSVVLVRDEIGFEEFLAIIEKVKQFGEPGFVFVDSTEHTVNPCVEVGMYPVYEENGVKDYGWQGCVSYDTKLITRNGVVLIGESAEKGEEIEIWNGQKWSKVKPIQTGENRKLYRVFLSDGSYLDATENHKFLVKNRFENEYREVTTQELIFELENTKYALNIPKPNIVYSEDEGVSEKYAYDYGFILGDGTIGKRNGSARTPFACVYSINYDKNFPVTGRWSKELNDYYNGEISTYKNVYFDSVDSEFAYKLKYDSGLPKEVFSWNRESIFDFLAGWIDTDGSITPSKTVRIYGEESKIRDAQLLCTKVGLVSSVNLAKKVGTKTNFGKHTRDLWYIQINPTEEMWCSKGELRNKDYNRKGKNQIIKSIVLLDGFHNSYCFEESELHQGTFGNFLTKQCNLTEINGGKCYDKHSFLKAVYGGAILGTLQAGYTDFKFVTETTRKIFEREALLGVSITGWMNNPEILLNEEILAEGAKFAIEINEKVAKLIGINPAARVTNVKPAGSTSVLLKTASGIHGEHSPMYIRNVQLNKETEVAKLIKEKNPYMVEESAWSSNKSDYVVSFPIIAPEKSIFRKDLLGINLLEKVKLVQQSWVENGTVKERCVDPTVRHNVSNTVSVDEDKWTEVAEYIYENRQYFAGISLLGSSGDKSYYQAPNTEVLTEKQIIEKYGPASLFASGLIVDVFKGFSNLWDATFIAQSDEDDSGQEIADIRADWIRRFKKFTNTYFHGDMKKADHCLKDVYLLHKWIKINQNFKPIDFAKEVTKKEYIDIDTMGSAACVGGACEI